MLIPANIPRFSIDRKHPYYSDTVYKVLSELVITLDGVPVSLVTEWSEPDGYVKVTPNQAELRRFMDLPKAQRKRRALGRRKGKVMVYRHMA